MSAPTLAGTWYSRGNVLFPDVSSAANINKSWMWNLKELLKGSHAGGTAGPIGITRPGTTFWVVIGSSDGTTAALDGTDRWTGTFDPTKIVQAANGVAHSWIVLMSPAALGPVYMCIDCNSATTTTAGFIFSRAAFTGGSTTSRPTSTNQWAAGVSADPVVTTNAVFTSDNTLSAIFRSQFSIDSTGAFNYFTGREGTGIFHSLLALFNTTDRNANDTNFTTFCVLSQSATGRGAPPHTSISSSAAGCTGRTVNGTLPQSTGGLNSWSFGGSAFNGVASVDSGGINFRTLPMYVYTLVASNNCWRGRVPDRWCVGGATVGDTYPDNVLPTQHVVGDWLLPLSVIPIM